MTAVQRLLQKKTGHPLSTKMDCVDRGSKSKYKMQTNVASLLEVIYLICTKVFFMWEWGKHFFPLFDTHKHMHKYVDIYTFQKNEKIIVPHNENFSSQDKFLPDSHQMGSPTLY